MVTISRAMFVVSVIASLIYSASSADTIQEVIDRNEYRAYYDRTVDLPDGASFSAVAGLVSALHKESGRAESISLVQDVTGLDGDSSAILAIKLIEADATITTSDKDRTRSILCEGKTAKVFGDDAFLALETLDDTRPVMAESVYEQVISDLSPEQGAALAKWVADAKKGIVQVDIDHRKSHARKNVSVDAGIAAICSS